MNVVVGRRRLRYAVALGDVACASLALLCSTVVESRWGVDQPRGGWMDGGPFVVGGGILVVWLASLALADSRDVNLLLAGADYYTRAIRATFGAFGVAAVGALAAGMDSARLMISLGFPLGVVLLVAGRWTVRNTLLRRIRKDPESWIRQRVLTLTSGTGTAPAVRFSSGQFPVFADLGSLVATDPEQVLSEASAVGATLVLVSRECTFTPRQVQLLGWRLDSVGIGLCVEPSSSFIRPGQTLLLPHPSATVLLVRTVHLSTKDRFLKRTADLVLATLLLPLLMPVALLAAAAVVLEDGFPARFAQRRVGRNGRSFTIHKLRTMYRDSDRDQPAPRSPKRQADPRCTRVGLVLRRWSIDEIPQLWCVFTGSMSLVGPRPRLEAELADSPEEYRRLEARPGISGLWQTSGRADLTFEDADLLDVEYVDNWSLIGDLVILARTVRTVLGRRGAY
ncbi:MAG: hypothetical protein F2934_01460 [Actinobacteria bacterium]|uniref:Unannotated protein n=1 Tax=freshwater metagenome TaxID=449393 RepID=A0A6J7TL49_9ZZZZ|nr:hypothetical protein [Actinomycetota bacterium]MSZ04371.1 hypothetical protein [Actinomycetota bacterium]MTB05780.1 hypothetical protein [Actinomycetota bacterium]